MTFPFAGLSSKPLADSKRAFRALAAPLVALYLLAIPLAVSAQQAPPAASGVTAAPAVAASAAGASSAGAGDAATALPSDDADSDPLANEETRDLPRVALSSEIVYQVLAAEIALQRGQIASAYQTYLALARSTHDPRMSQRAAEIALVAQSPADALVAARIWHQDAPNSPQAAQLDASLLVLSGKLDEAEPLLAAQLAKVPEPTRGNAILSLQLLFSHAPDPAAAVRTLQRLLQDDMDRPEAQLAVARQQMQANDEAGARISLEAALKLKPDYEPAALLLAQLGAPERQEAIDSLAGFVKKNPQARSARIALAQIYLADGQVDAAQKQFETMRKLNPNDLPPLLALGLIKMQQKQYDDAQKYFVQYTDLAQKQTGNDADPGQGYLYLSQIAMLRNDPATAMNWLQKVDVNSPQYLPAQIARAQLLTHQGKYDDARAVLAVLRSRDPHKQVIIGRADAGVLMAASRYPQAEQRLAGLVQAFPDDPDVLYDYAMAAERNHHYDLMENELRHLIVIDPTNPQAYNSLGYSLVDRNLQIPEGTSLIEKASALAPNDPFIMDSLGWARFRGGNAAQALTILQRAYQIEPNAEIGAHLGEVLWALNRHVEALQAWSNALKLEPNNETLLQTLKRFDVNSSNL